MSRAKSAFVDRTGQRTIGDAISEQADSGDGYDGPMLMEVQFSKAISKCLSVLGAKVDEEAARTLSHVCTARRTFLDTKRPS